MRWIISFAIVAVAAPVHADFRAGVAQVDITPDYPVRLSGFGGRRTESEGVWQRIQASAVAFDDGKSTVLIAVDNLGVPASMTAEVAHRLKLPIERLAICSTHTHTGPMLAGVAPTLFGQPIPPEHQAHIDRYTRELTDKLTEVGQKALADLKPGRLSWGVGTAGFAINRRTKGGPVDHDLPLLAVHGEDGKLRAVVVGYACHCVTLSHNQIGGDWAGCAREAIQRAHPGAIALTTIGCGADQNPDSGVTGGKTEIAEAQGRAVAAEVDRLLGQFLAPVREPIAASNRRIELPLADPPPRAQWEEKAKRTDAVGYHARVNLARLDKGEPLISKIDYGITTWSFGAELAMAFLPGEVVVDYGIRLKRELDGRRLWVAAYSNDSPCYIPSERVLKEGGYEGGDAMVYYDKPAPFRPGLEEKIVGVVRDSLGVRFASPFDPAKVPSRPPSPQQARAAIRTRDGLTVDLVAAEPLVTSPVAIAFGPDGRLWVAEMCDYPAGRRGDYKPGGRITVLSDRDGFGRYRTSTVFLDNIPFPTGVTAWRNGVLICAAPDILYAEDSKGGGKADIVIKLYSGFGTENFQARVNSLEYGLDGWVYGSCGLFGGTIKSFNGSELKLGNRDFRIKPDTGEVEPAAGRTQQGRVRDDWDNWFGCDNSNLAWHYPLPDHYIRRNPHAAPSATFTNVSAEPQPNRVFPANANLQLFKLSGPPGWATAACGIGIYRDDLVGRDWQGNLFTCETVNSLVHRLVLEPRGCSFGGRRAAGEEKSEVVASTNQWFRPVQARTGPDGCLYVVDMARYVIEHPRWIPQEDLAKLDVRAGSTLGRIYRIRPANKSPRAVPRLDKLDTAALVNTLDTPNGPIRDLATQMLLWRGDKAAAPLLDKLTTHDRPETRLHALVALDGLKALKPEHVRAALGDADAGVRRHAVRLAERFTDSLGPRIAEMAADPNMQVRLQVAFSLGEWRDSRSGAALASLADGSGPFLSAAITSSLGKGNLGSFAAGILPGDAKREPPSSLVHRLLATAVAMNDRPTLNAMLKNALYPKSGRTRAWQCAILTGALDALDRSSTSRESLLDESTLTLVDECLTIARETVANTTDTLELRLAAIPLLGRRPSTLEPDLRALQSILAPQQPPELQTAAASVLGRIADRRIAGMLLSSWPSHSPKLQIQIVDLLLDRAEGPPTILDAIEKKLIPVGSIDAPRRQQMITHRDATIRDRAVRVFGGSSNTDRAKVLREHHDVIDMSGDVARGKAVFAKSCATCHRLHDVGYAVGPDLAQLANKSPNYLLQEILDPNRAVDSRYIEYSALTKVGKVYRGLLAEESATSVTLKAGDGKTEQLLRTDIDTLESTGRSLMPEGMEKDLKKQDLADVIAYLSGGATELARKLLDESLPAAERRALIVQTAGRSAEVIAAMTGDLGDDAKEEYRRIPWIWQVAIAAGKRDDFAELRRLLDASLPQPHEALRDWQSVVLGGGIINGISQKGAWPRGRFNELLHDDDPLIARWERVVLQAAAMADDERVPTGTRYDALRVIAIAGWTYAGPRLDKYLPKGTNDELQMGAISGLADIDEAPAAGKLLGVLGHANAENRGLALDALVRNEARAAALLDAMESKKVDLKWLSDGQKQKLRAIADPGLRDRALKLLH